MGVVLMSKRELNRIDVLTRLDAGRLSSDSAPGRWLARHRPFLPRTDLVHGRCHRWRGRADAVAEAA